VASAGGDEITAAAWAYREMRPGVAGTPGRTRRSQKLCGSKEGVTAPGAANGIY